MRCETHMKSDGILCFCVIYHMSLRHASQHADVVLYNTMAGSDGVYFKFQIFVFFLINVGFMGYSLTFALCGFWDCDVHLSKTDYWLRKYVGQDLVLSIGCW